MEDTNAKSKFFEIDKLRLDSEWVEQPKLFHKYSTRLADAKEELERAKAHKDVVEAELGRDIRSDPAKYDLPKVTEGAVEACILLQPSYQAALDQVIKSRHNVDLLQAAVDTLDHKKKALESLVYLHGQDYFSAPVAPHAEKEKMEEMQKKQIRRRGK